MNPIVEDTTRDHEDDVAAIRQVIADIETGFNTNDADLLVAHFTRNGTAVSVGGVLLSGWEEMLEASRAGLAGPLRDQYARYELADVTFLRPDIAVAHKRARAISAEGEPIDVDHTMIALYVLVREDGRWWVAARQNTMAAA
jgi:uncharacterized protein (TIGR02246 family)